MNKPTNDEVISLVLAIEYCRKNRTLNLHGFAYLAGEAAKMIRRLRPDLAFTDDTNAHS